MKPWIGNRRLTVSGYTVSLPHLPPAWRGARLVHLSDLHAACFGNKQDDLVAAVAALSPQAVLITGDLIDRRRTHTDDDMLPALTLLERLSAMVPTVRVDGNHEVMSAVGARFRERADRTDAVNATGRAVTLERDGDRLTVVGIPDIADPAIDYDEAKWQAVAMNLTASLKDCAGLVLSHRPHFTDTYARFGPTAVLSGHAHGGQWRLPLIGGLFAPDQGLFPRYTAGCRLLGKTPLIISRGLGNSGFPLRLFNPPELVVITLENDPT